VTTVAVTVPQPEVVSTTQSVLRVAHVNANFAGGSGAIMLREAVAVDPERFATTILAPGGGPLFERAQREGVDVITLQHTGGGRHIYPAADVAAVRELSRHIAEGEFDVVHTHAGRAGAIGRIAAHRAGVRAIVHTLHGFPFNEFQNPATRAALRTVERRLGRITDYFLTDGSLVASEAVRLRIAPPDRIRAVISPIDPVPVTSPAARRTARRVLGLPEDAKIVGAAARLAEQKAPLDMVEAIAGLGRRDVYMVWLGDGELRPSVERRIAERGLTDRFILAGDRDDVARLLPAFDVFALSSLWEGLPCSLVEAMTCGIPVAVTAVNSVPELVLSARTGLLARPGDPASLTRAIAYLLDNPDEAARMAEAARIQIGHQFRADRLGADLMHVYETALRLAAPRTRRI
jgi:glycosyltransferase involved in cell wall biosynthesis